MAGVRVHYTKEYWSMSENSRISGIINNWVQVIGIILAGIWALYTFGYKEWYLPRQKTSHFQIDLKLENKGIVKLENAREGANAILVKIKGTNTSDRCLYIASAYLQVWGDTILWSEIDDKDFKKIIPTIIETANTMQAKYMTKRNSQTIFYSPLFKNWSFEPDESLTTYRLFHVPHGKFDQLEAKGFVLSGPHGKDIKIKYKVTDKMDIDYMVIVEKNGKEIELSPSSKEFKKLRMGKIRSNAFLVLGTGTK